jgi:hypothetical protein
MDGVENQVVPENYHANVFAELGEQRRGQGHSCDLGAPLSQHVGWGKRRRTPTNRSERNRTVSVDCVDVHRSVMREVKARHPFHIDAIVILPEHLHAI